MAKITVEHDTQDKSMNVAVDGKKLKNVHSVAFANRNMSYDGTRYEKDKKDNYEAHIQMVHPAEGDCGYMTHERIMASINSTDGEKAAKAGEALEVPGFPDMVVYLKEIKSETEELDKDVANFMNTKE